MKKLLVMLLCLGLVGCQFGGSETEKPEEPNTENPTPEVEEPEVEEPEVEEPEVEAPYVAPAFYKYYVDNGNSMDDNVAMALGQANLGPITARPIVVDSDYNTVVLVQVNSKIKQIGNFYFDLDKFTAVDYSIDEYVNQYSNEGIVLVEQPENEVLAFLCTESEGIPRTALWYKDEAGTLHTIKLQYNGVQQTEGLIN